MPFCLPAYRLTARPNRLTRQYVSSTTSHQCRNLSEGADSVGRQMRGDKDRVPFQWRLIVAEFGGRVPESEAWGVSVKVSNEKNS